MSVQAMKGGAIEFLTKPFRDQDLLDAIQLGLSRDRARRENEKALAALRERFASLSPREREIMIQVARGRLSKQIAHDIGIAEATVKVHRSRAMRKMKARSLPELGRMADKLQLAPEEPQRSLSCMFCATHYSRGQISGQVSLVLYRPSWPRRKHRSGI